MCQGLLAADKMMLCFSSSTLKDMKPGVDGATSEEWCVCLVFLSLYLFIFSCSRPLALLISSSAFSAFVETKCLCAGYVRMSLYGDVYVLSSRVVDDRL